MRLVTTGLRDRVDLCADVASILRWSKQCDDTIFLYGFDRLWNESHEALTAHADVFVVVVRAINSKVISARAQAIDRNAIHQSVFYGQGAMLDQPYPQGNPWHLEGSRSLEYDPEKAKSLLKAARAVGTAIKIVCNVTFTFHRESAQIVQEMWNSVGFKVTLEPLDTVPILNTLKKGDFDGLIGGNTYRFDPDGFFERNFYSKSDLTQILSGWHNERYNRLVEEAKRTLDPARRKALYTEGWNIVNVELPHFHLHEVTIERSRIRRNIWNQ